MTSMKDYFDQMIGKGTNDDGNVNDQEDLFDDFVEELRCPFCKSFEISMFITATNENPDDRVILTECRDCRRRWATSNMEGEDSLLDIDFRSLFSKILE